MLGAIIGDIVGSIYEFNNHRSKDFEFFGPDADFTDDTVCTIAVADALLNGADPVDALHDWCGRYPNRGYGGMFARWLATRSRKSYNSFGNGAAMRVGPAFLMGGSLDESLHFAEQVTVVTHDHPEGIKGAKSAIHAAWLAREGLRSEDIRREITRVYGYDLDRTVAQIRPSYRFNETCQETVPEALICALEACDFEDAIRNAISIGGDSDTVAAIAGIVAEALFPIPEPIARIAISKLPADMRIVLDGLYRKAHGIAPSGVQSEILKKSKNVPDEASITYWNCDGVPVSIVNHMATAYDVPSGRLFRSAPKPGSWDQQITKEAFDALVSDVAKSRKDKGNPG